MKHKGLGDTIEEILKKSGVKYVANQLLGEDCGCDERKETLNEKFPYKQTEKNDKQKD
jgi:hypothetical protein|tara:strand:+ start:201 stop:374 length:174 start_codon:yes stop_codon:yes gene_type:complete